MQVGNIIPIAEMRKLYLGKSQLACSLLSVEKWCKRSLGFAEAHKPLEGRSHVWVIFVSPVTGWTCDSVKVPVPCEMIQGGFREEGDEIFLQGLERLRTQSRKEGLDHQYKVWLPFSNYLPCALILV